MLPEKKKKKKNYSTNWGSELQVGHGKNQTPLAWLVGDRKTWTYIY